jgi:hypothetical protein
MYVLATSVIKDSPALTLEQIEKVKSTGLLSKPLM